jgi:hypothetical protein
VETSIADAKTHLDALARAAQALRAGVCTTASFAQSVRDARALIDALPPAYERAMNEIVTRLESAALFGGESCSFSHTELYDALNVWIEKARGKLNA